MGTIAVASGTATTAITLITDYSHNLSKTIRRPKQHPGKDKQKEDGGNSSLSDDPAPYSELAKSESLDIIPSRNPVSRAMNYDPQHMEGLAYRMVSKSLPQQKKTKPTMKYGRKKVKTYSIVMGDPATVKPERRSTGRNRKQHGRVYDVSVETRRFAQRMAITGLKGKLL